MQQPGICYAEGKYLMMYLYSKGLPRKWYDAYVTGFKDDSTGGKAMEAVMGKNLDEIEKDFVAYAMALTPVATANKGSHSGHDPSSMVPDGLRIKSILPLVAASSTRASRLGTSSPGLTASGWLTATGWPTYISDLAICATVQVEFPPDGSIEPCR